MRKRKRRQREDDHIDESWLIPYADLLTLLLALFIVLFAISSVDAKKFQTMSRAFNDVFTGGSGVLDFTSMEPPLDPLPIEKKDPSDQKQQEKEEYKSLLNIKKHVDHFILNNKLQNQLNTKLTDEGLFITIKDNILFDSGSAEIRNEVMPLAKEISELLVIQPQRNIIINGHTDNVPIHNSVYNSNWKLSAIRAVNFLDVLLENPQLDSNVFSTKGYGEHKPIADNASSIGREKNRRVEILIKPIETKDS
ncbi:flagellar motor protein MotB [Bacillus gobiensis]|uniref:flagellar motor protein MotB n=1 Tax=Bacillus gobiensis TaxID=1441095 RepID=UPI003D20270E